MTVARNLRGRRGVEKLHMDEVREARHNLRGRLNALKLCVSAFDILDSPREVLEFLEMIEQGADKTVLAMDALDAAMDRQEPATH
jgi:hypothetical protein